MPEMPGSSTRVIRREFMRIRRAVRVTGVTGDRVGVAPGAEMRQIGSLRRRPLLPRPALALAVARIARIALPPGPGVTARARDPNPEKETETEEEEEVGVGKLFLPRRGSDG